LWSGMGQIGWTVEWQIDFRFELLYVEVAQAIKAEHLMRNLVDGLDRGGVAIFKLSQIEEDAITKLMVLPQVFGVLLGNLRLLV